MLEVVKVREWDGRDELDKGAVEKDQKQVYKRRNVIKKREKMKGGGFNRQNIYRGKHWDYTKWGVCVCAREGGCVRGGLVEGVGAVLANTDAVFVGSA